MGGITGHIIAGRARAAGRRPLGAAALGGLALLLGACVADQTEATVRPAVVRVRGILETWRGPTLEAGADAIEVLGEADRPGAGPETERGLRR